MHEKNTRNIWVLKMLNGRKYIAKPGVFFLPRSLSFFLRRHMSLPDEKESTLLLSTVFLLGQWLNFKLFGITYVVGKIKFKLFFRVHWLSEFLWEEGKEHEGSLNFPKYWGNQVKHWKNSMLFLRDFARNILKMSIVWVSSSTFSPDSKPFPTLEIQ